MISWGRSAKRTSSLFITCLFRRSLTSKYKTAHDHAALDGFGGYFKYSSKYSETSESDVT